MLLLWHSLVHQIDSQKWRTINGISKAVLVSLCYLISSRLQTFHGGLVSCFIKILSCTEIFFSWHLTSLFLWDMAIPTARGKQEVPQACGEGSWQKRMQKRKTFFTCSLICKRENIPENSQASVISVTDPW